MSDYKAYRAEKDLTPRQIISAMQGEYSHYNKAVQSMVEHPEKYGVQLTAAAERLLLELFGPSQHLTAADVAFTADAPTAENRRPAPRRAKPNRLTVRLTDELYHKVKQLMAANSITTDQQFLEFLINNWLSAANNSHSAR